MDVGSRKNDIIPKHSTQTPEGNDHVIQPQTPLSIKMKYNLSSALTLTIIKIYLGMPDMPFEVRVYIPFVTRVHRGCMKLNFVS